MTIRRRPEKPYPHFGSLNYLLVADNDKNVPFGLACYAYTYQICYPWQGTVFTTAIRKSAHKFCEEIRNEHKLILVKDLGDWK